MCFTEVVEVVVTIGQWQPHLLKETFMLSVGELPVTFTPHLIEGDSGLPVYKDTASQLQSLLSIILVFQCSRASPQPEIH